MDTRKPIHTLFLVAVVGLLAWQGLHTGTSTASALPEASTTTGSISVTGSSAIRVQPDRVVILFGVEAFASTPSHSRALCARQSRDVVSALQKLRIAERDIATTRSWH